MQGNPKGSITDIVISVYGIWIIPFFFSSQMFSSLPSLSYPQFTYILKKTTRKLEIYLWLIWNTCCARVLLWAQYSQISPSSVSLPHFKKHGVSEMNFSTAIIIFAAASKLASGYFSYWKQHSFSKSFYNYS